MLFLALRFLKKSRKNTFFETSLYLYQLFIKLENNSY